MLQNDDDLRERDETHALHRPRRGETLAPSRDD